jgi:hypothetical protein
MKIQYTDSGIILDFTLVRQDDSSIALLDVGYVPVYCWKQDTMIRALPSGAYMDERPEDMSSSAYSRMKASYGEIVRLMGDQFVAIER